MQRRLISAAMALALFFGTSMAAWAAESAADFYKDRQMIVIVPTPPGGLFDLFSRLLANYMPKHIPGNPHMIAQNMGGSGGLVAANHMANVAPKDGSVIAAGYSSSPTASLFQPNDAKFNSADLAWIGNITKDPYVAYTWYTSDIRSLDDLKTKEGIFGGNALGSASIDYAIYARDMFGLKIKIITGYPNSVDVKLAMERGEIQGAFANGWSSLKTGEPTWVPEKKVFLLTQFGLKKHPDMPDVPLFLDLAKNDQDKQALELVLSRTDISRPYFAPPGTPPDRLEVLRRAFDATMKDPGFLADAKKANAPVDGPMTGEEVSAIVKHMAATPPETVNRIAKMLSDFQKTR